MLRPLLAKLLRRLADRVQPHSESLEQEDKVFDAEGEELWESRRQAALSVTEDDVEGFLLLVMSPHKGDAESKITVQAAVPNHAWPAFIESMGRVETFTQEHGRRSN